MRAGMFERQLKTAYQQSSCKFSIEDSKAVFDYYFAIYEEYTGRDHPPLRTSKLVDLLNSIDGDGLFIPECYPDMIDSYFDTAFQSCDRNICHFFSGKIRALRFFEACY